MGKSVDVMNVLIGAVALVGRNGPKLVNKLQERGALNESDAAQILREVANNTEEAIKKGVNVVSAAFKAAKEEIKGSSATPKPATSSRTTKKTSKKTAKKR